MISRLYSTNSIKIDGESSVADYVSKRMNKFYKYWYHFLELLIPSTVALTSSLFLYNNNNNNNNNNKVKSYATMQRTEPDRLRSILQLCGNMIWYMLYLLTAIGLSPTGSSTVHIYTQIINRTIQNQQYIEQHNNFGRVRAVPRLG